MILRICLLFLPSEEEEEKEEVVPEPRMSQPEEKEESVEKKEGEKHPYPQPVSSLSNNTLNLK